MNVPKIEFADNLDCIELFESVPTGLLDLLDEEARLPKPSPQHFTDCVHKCNKDHFRLTVSLTNFYGYFKINVLMINFSLQGSPN